MKMWLKPGPVEWYWVTGTVEALRDFWMEPGMIVGLDPKTGLVMHTAGFYLVDSNGVLRYYIKLADSTLEVAADISRGLYEIVASMAGGGGEGWGPSGRPGSPISPQPLRLRSSCVYGVQNLCD